MFQLSLHLIQFIVRRRLAPTLVAIKSPYQEQREVNNMLANDDD